MLQYLATRNTRFKGLLNATKFLFFAILPERQIGLHILAASFQDAAKQRGF